MKIAALTSGGVDSSVALSLLKDKGYDVTAFYLKIWLEDELSYLGSCPWEEDLSFARAVCQQLGVPLEIVSLQKEYFEYVVHHTIEQIKAGLTPNPDMFCNQRIKFGMFFDKVPQEFTYAATGHYAQVQHSSNGSKLLCSPDLLKDQTYFLSYLRQNQLQKALFPIGHLQKSQVRTYAQERQLAPATRKDSQGICFLGKLKFSDFIKHYLGIQKGSIVEFESGKILGTHQGYWYHTIGQRQGSGLAGGPWYVVSKDIQQNIIYMSRTYHEPDKQRNTCTVTQCNWIDTHIPNTNTLEVKLRHGANRYKAHVIYLDNQTVHITLDQNDQGIAAGQFVAFYQEDQCLGSGIIYST
ncbi:tRNA 2-thiouridine(34) synthase MnmA [Vermiphilus pyriformis]|nr:MAG: tRNA 2-thiouridine(34) synthase MnmA [Vermiphilus pyriformis]